MKLLDKKKTKDWEKEFDNKFGTNQAYIIKTGFVSSNEPQMELSDVKQFISTLLSTQRQQILEEIKTRVDTWGGFEDDGGNLCHYDSEIKEDKKECKHKWKLTPDTWGETCFYCGKQRKIIY